MASFFAFVANRAGLQNTAAATSLLSDYAQVLGHDTSALTEDHENQGLDIAELAALKETTYPAESVKMSECPVCLTDYDDRLPGVVGKTRALAGVFACGHWKHSMCRDCLAGVLASNQRRCPVCRAAPVP